MMHSTVDKTPVLLFYDVISLEILTLLALPVAFLKIACSHLSFTAYENFYRLS